MAKKAKFKVKDLFQINVPDNFTVVGNEKPEEENPAFEAVDPDYVFRSENLLPLIFWFFFRPEDSLFLTGPTGSGKSSLVLQFLARLNIPRQRVVGHSRLEIPELTGKIGIQDGNTVWQDGPLTIAMREGHVFVFDEIDLLDPAILAGLNGIAEGAPLVLPDNEGEVVYPHPDFKFVATGNTNGGGDESGLYQGTFQQNAAFGDRFQFHEVGYPDRGIEVKILEKISPKMPEAFRKKFVDVANTFRKLFLGEDDPSDSHGMSALEIPMSTRTLIRWVSCYDMYLRNSERNNMELLIETLDFSFANRLSKESREAVHEYIQRVFEKEIS
jgi:cobaltochelatase CobS